MTAAAIAVHVLTGFLGSGKSTLLNRALRSPALADSAVVVNEFGDVGIDHLLVETSDDLLVELAGGCVCCAVRGDLALTLAALLSRRRAGGCAAFSNIIIETTGLADPNPVLNLLATDALLAEQTRAAGVVTVVDAINGAVSLERYDEARIQVALADRLILSKTDLADPAPATAAMRRLNTRAAIQHAIDGALDDGASPFAAMAEGPLAGRMATAGGHHHHAGIETFTLRRTIPLPGAALPLLVTCLAEQLGADLLRLKGLVQIEELPDRPALLQGAQHVFHPLEFLAGWPQDGPPRTELVFIVRGSAREWIERTVDAIVWESRDAGVRLRASANHPGTCA